jgi:hypothetical protein
MASSNGNGSVRGAGVARAGASDTTMLIWKTIKANPGITREQLWEKVEHGIPSGYALRRFGGDARDSRLAHRSASRTTRARQYVLTKSLASMTYLRLIVRMDGCYSALKQPQYRGNPDVVDHTGTKAAEHMAAADALRVLEKTVARAKPNIPHQSPVHLTQKEYDALVLLVKTVRDKGITSASTATIQ